MTYPGITITYPGINITYPGITITYPGINITYPGINITYPGINMKYPGSKYLSLVNATMAAMSHMLSSGFDGVSIHTNLKTGFVTS